MLSRSVCNECLMLPVKPVLSGAGYVGNSIVRLGQVLTESHCGPHLWSPGPCCKYCMLLVASVHHAIY
jgi:hypothetical protein